MKPVEYIEGPIVEVSFWAAKICSSTRIENDGKGIRFPKAKSAKKRDHFPNASLFTTYGIFVISPP